MKKTQIDPIKRKSIINFICGSSVQILDVIENEVFIKKREILMDIDLI